MIYIYMFPSSVYSIDEIAFTCELVRFWNGFSSWFLFIPAKPDRKAPERMTWKFTLKKYKDQSLLLQTWTKNKLYTIYSLSYDCNEPAVAAVCRNKKRLQLGSCSRCNPWLGFMVIGLLWGSIITEY